VLDEETLPAGAVVCLALAAPPGAGVGQAPTADLLLRLRQRRGHRLPDRNAQAGGPGFPHVLGRQRATAHRAPGGRDRLQRLRAEAARQLSRAGRSPPPRFDSTGGGPFTSGDFTLVDAGEQLSDSAPAAWIVSMRLSLRPRNIVGSPRAVLTARARICGRLGTALLRFAQASSPAGRDRPVSVRTEWQDQLRHERPCETHRVNPPLTRFPSGRRYRIELTARTSERRWSRTVVRRVDAL
jgi:hypothetical protein